MTTDRIDIVISERGSRTVRRNIESLGKSSRRAEVGIRALRLALVGVGTGLVANQAKTFLDSYQGIQNLLRATAKEQENYNVTLERLIQIANKTRSPLDEMVRLYSKGSIASKELGFSQEQLFQVVENIGLALAQQGVSAKLVRGAMLQLSQSMGSGIVRAEEFNSVLEGAFPIALAIAKGYDKVGGSVAKLRRDILEGKVTSEEYFLALLSQTESLKKTFGQTESLIAQAFIILENQITLYIGRLDEALGFSAAFARAITKLAFSLEGLVKVMAVLATASVTFVLLNSSASILTSTLGLFSRTLLFILANPITLFISALVAAASYLYLFRDSIELGVDEITKFGDYLVAFGQTVKDWAAPILAEMDALLIEAGRRLIPISESIKGFLGEIDFSIIGFIRLTAKYVDSFIGVWKGALFAVFSAFENLPSALGDLIIRAVNVVLRKLTAFVNGAIELLEPLTKLADIEIKPVSFVLDNRFEGEAKQYGQNIGKAFLAGYESVDFAKRFVEDTVTRAQATALARQAQERIKPVPQQDSTTEAEKQLDDETKSLISSLQSLIAQYDGVYQAQQEYAEGVKILSDAEAAGLITLERKNQVLYLMAESLRDSLDPIAAVNRELDREFELLRMTSIEREVSNQLYSIQQDLLNQGIILGEIELAQLREKLTLLQEETQINTLRSQVLESMIGRQKEFISELQVINELIQQGDVTRDQALAYLLDRNSSLLEGTAEAQRAWVEQYRQTYEQIEALRQADLISEQTAVQLKARANVDLQEKQLKGAASLFGQLAGLSRSGNRQLSAIGRAAAATEATIYGVVAVQRALASASPPLNYALAAAVGATAAANVARILSEDTPKFAFGGDFTVPGVGGTDSQLVAFRATPGESVSIKTPTQNREESRNSEGGTASTPEVRVINVIDPNLVGDYINTSNGEDAVLNVIRRNSDSLRNILAEG